MYRLQLLPFLLGCLLCPINGSILECHLSYQTNVWTTCQDVLNKFNISLDMFSTSNTNVSSNCGNFIPGSSYCVSAISK